MEKITNAVALSTAISAIEGISIEHKTEVLAKLNKMLEQTVKKNTAERKPTATQTENVGFKTAILNGMEVGKQYTITELTKAVPEIANLTNQRVSAIVRQMVEAGQLTRTEEKRKAYFSKAVEEVEE